MGILEEISQMKEQGMMDNEIANNLRQRGHSPKEINDALNQSQIKNAVAGEREELSMQGMEPSIMNQEELPPPTPHSKGGYTSPQTKEIQEGYEEDFDKAEQDTYMPLNQGEFPAPESQEQAYYPQDGYTDYSQGASDVDTIIEIAEQIFAEKIKKIQKQTEDITEFATLSQTKIENFSSRLKRIENTIDKLQSAILEKIGSYGKNLETTKKEMTMMQDSFRKLATAKKHHSLHTIPKKKISKKK